MIGIKLNGRLGNQMFQYAFGYATARGRFTLFFSIENKDADKYILPQYFKLRRFENYKQKIARKLYNRTKKYIKPAEIAQGGESNISETPLLSQAMYTGFFQSELYFKKYEKQIKKLFTLKQEHIDAFNNKYIQYFNEGKTLVVHFRGGDYFTWSSKQFGGENVTLPVEYYKNCFAKIENLHNYKIIFVSDSIEFMKQNFSYLQNAFFICDKEILDFQLLLNADKLIISNSSFAWWGGYLNYKNAEVFAPAYWLGFKVKKEYPLNILSTRYRIIDF